MESEKSWLRARAADVCIINPGDHHQGICGTIKNAPVTQWIWKCWKHFLLFRKDVRTSTYKLPFVKELRHVPALMDQQGVGFLTWSRPFLSYWSWPLWGWVDPLFWHAYSHGENKKLRSKKVEGLYPTNSWQPTGVAVREPNKTNAHALKQNRSFCIKGNIST